MLGFRPVMPEYDEVDFDTSAATYAEALPTGHTNTGHTNTALHEQQATGSDGGHVQPSTFVPTRGAHGTLASQSLTLTSLPLSLKMACKQNLDWRCVFDPSNLGAGAKPRPESRIKKFTPHCVCRPPRPVVRPGHGPRVPRCRRVPSCCWYAPK